MARVYKPDMMIKRIKYASRGRPVIAVTPGGLRRSLMNPDKEVLTGMVLERKASAGEERWARTLYTHKVNFEFRLALGAPRNLPGWFEIDFLFPINGVYRALEVDSAFTHRTKEYKDVLHDAMVLRELNYIGIYPKVYHIDNERDLATQEISDRTYRRLFG